MLFHRTSLAWRTLRAVSFRTLRPSTRSQRNAHARVPSPGLRHELHSHHPGPEREWGRATRAGMRLRTLWDDVAACILLDIPRSLRLAVFILCLLLAYATGILWAISAGYQVDTVRTQARGELMEVRMHVRQLWGAYEALRTRQDREELQSRRDGDGVLPAEESEGNHTAEEQEEAELLTLPVPSLSRGPSRAPHW